MAPTDKDKVEGLTMMAVGSLEAAVTVTAHCRVEEELLLVDITLMEAVPAVSGVIVMTLPERVAVATMGLVLEADKVASASVVAVMEPVLPPAIKLSVEGLMEREGAVPVKEISPKR